MNTNNNQNSNTENNNKDNKSYNKENRSYHNKDNRTYNKSYNKDNNRDNKSFNSDNNRNRDNNEGFKRVNGETRSRNYANNKRTFNRDNNSGTNNENGEVRKERYTDKTTDRNVITDRNSNRSSDRNNSQGSDRKPYNKNYNNSYNNKRDFNGDRNSNNNKNYNKNYDNKRQDMRVQNEANTRYENGNAFSDVEVDDEELENLQLEGRNAVLEAIRIKRPIDKILLKKGEVEGTLKVIKAKAIAEGIIVQETSKNNLDEMSKSHNHQGVIAMCAAQEYAEVEDMLALAKERGEDPFIMVLDGITDTYNLGAIIRTANAAGAHGVIIPKRRAAGLTAMVSKASAGAILYTKVARVTNITTEIEKLKEAGLWIVGTDMKAKSLYETNLKGPVAVVIGSEGTGISRLVKEKCDLKVSVPMLGEIESLNASVASGVLMYEIVRQRLNG